MPRLRPEGRLKTPAPTLNPKPSVRRNTFSDGPNRKPEYETAGRISDGLTVLLGVGTEDTEADARYIADKIAALRIFEDGDGKLNRSLQDTGGAVLLVSQFTLYADARNGRRPSFSAAARPEQAERLYQAVADLLRGHGLTVETGRFQTHMQITLCNDGPVTLLLDSNKLF